MSDRPPHFLLLQLKRIGDLILTAPALAALRHHNPQMRITLVTAPTCQELATILPGHPRVLPAGNTSLATFAKIARGGFSWCFDFSGTDRSAFLTALGHARYRATYARHCECALRRRLYTTKVDALVRNLHTVDYHLALLAPIGIIDVPRCVPFHFPAVVTLRAERLLGELSDFIVLHPGTARPEKYWLPERWAEAANHAVSITGLPLVITGSGDPHERRHVDAITEFLDRPPLDLCGKTSLPELAAVLARARLLLCVDSAAMHLGSAAGTPTVALFGPTNPFHWRPLSEKAVVLQAGNPDALFEPRRPGSPMEQLSTDTVTDAINTLLHS